MKHSATPWTYKNVIDGYFEIGPVDETLRLAAQTLGEEVEDEENAAFIVRAVNCHEELLSVLRIAQATIHATWKSLGLPKVGLRPLYIEVKRPGGVRRPAQIRFITSAKEAGCVAGFCESWKDCVDLFAGFGVKLPV